MTSDEVEIMNTTDDLRWRWEDEELKIPNSAIQIDAQRSWVTKFKKLIGDKLETGFNSIDAKKMGSKTCLNSASEAPTKWDQKERYFDPN